jgi:molecular chaperone HtpG
MKDGQKSIYYLAGGSIDSLSSSPKLEAFKSRGVNVLLLSDPVDEIWTSSARKFEDFEFVSISSADVEIPGESAPGEENDLTKKAESSGLAAKLKQAISELGGAASNIEDVRFSSRLVDSPATFVQKGEPVSPQMRNLFKAMGQDIPPEKRMLELNPSHPLIGKIMNETEQDSEKMPQWASLLLGLASIADGEPVENGRDFTKTLMNLLEK